MGDRTWVELTYHISEEERVNAIFDGPDERYVVGNMVVAHYCEMNYGASSQLDEMHVEHIPYLVKWGSGSEYGPGVSVYDGITCCEADTAGGSIPVVPVNVSGKVNYRLLCASRRYLKLRKQVAIQLAKPTPVYTKWLEDKLVAHERGKKGGRRKPQPPTGILKEVDDETSG